jgi:hypothetical protein
LTEAWSPHLISACMYQYTAASQLPFTPNLIYNGTWSWHAWNGHEKRFLENFIQLWLSQKLQVTSSSRWNRIASNFQKPHSFATSQTCCYILFLGRIECHTSLLPADPRNHSWPQTEATSLCTLLICDTTSPIWINIALWSYLTIWNILDSKVYCTLQVTYHMLCRNQVNTSWFNHILTQSVHRKAYIWPIICQIHQRTNHIPVCGDNHYLWRSITQ